MDGSQRTRQQEALESGVDLVIATPGRLQSLEKMVISFCRVSFVLYWTKQMLWWIPISGMTLPIL